MCKPRIARTVIRLSTVMTVFFFCSVACGDQDEALIEAARKGDVKQVQDLLDKGVDVNARDKNSWTPLMYAISGSTSEIVIASDEDKDGEAATGPEDVSPSPEDVVRLLLEKGAFVNAKDNYGETALMQAASQCASQCNLDVMRLLVDKGADVNAQDKRGQTALMRVASEGDSLDDSFDLEFVAGRSADIRAKDEGDETDSSLKLTGLYADEAKLLLDHGALVNEKDKYGETALMKAVRHDRANMAKLLKARGAETTLIIAAILGDKEDVLRFIEAGTDVNAKTSYGLTPLMGAAGRGHAGIIRILLDKGADINPKALDFAIQPGQSDVVNLLLDRVGDINAGSEYGWLPLHSAARICDADILKLLLDKGADVNAKDKNGRSALMEAVAIFQANRSPTVVVRRLLEKRAEVNARDKNGKTALILAAELGHAEAV